MIRPLLPADAADCVQVTHDALVAIYDSMPPDTPEYRARAELRVRHLQSTDPGSAWVAC